MRKKKTDEIRFDPAGYSYMKNMPLEGWLWEFERRSKEYRTAYSQFFKRHSETSKKAYLQKVRSKFSALLFFNSCRFNPSKKWNEVRQVHAYLSRSHPVELINLKWGWTHPSENSEPLEIPQIGIEGSKTIVTYDSRNWHPLDSVRHEIGREHIVMALINLSANKKEVIQLIDDGIDRWKNVLKIVARRTPKKSTKKNFNIWKSYLMVYDLIGDPRRIAFKQAADKLFACFPDIKEYENERNIENYYKAAESLIKGRYKSLLGPA